MSYVKFFINHDKSDSFVNKLRRKRFQLVQSSIENLLQKDRKFKIIDLGGDINYWVQLDWQQPNIETTLLNLYDNNLDDNLKSNFISIKGNALDTPFKGKSFDLVFSNSVIEHVGSYENQSKFADEVRRLSNRYIIQTPSLWFPLEPHSLIPLFQFIPHSIRAILIMLFNINYFPKAKNYSEALVTSRTTLMFTKKRFKALFPEAHIHVEKLFGIPKSYTAVKL
jgi:2-polyprenyl-3-methyl-5-hydroxy-6-metoxy-1,4-benzoquinol methylase